MGNQMAPSIEEMQAQTLAQMQAGQAANEEMLQRVQNTSGGSSKVPKPGGAFGAGPQVQPAPPPPPSAQATSTDVAMSGPASRGVFGAFMQGPEAKPPPPLTPIEQKIMQQELAYQARQQAAESPQRGSAFTPPTNLEQAPAPIKMGKQSMTREDAVASGMAKPKKQPGILEMFGYDEEATGMQPLQWLFSSPDAIQNAKTEVANKQAATQALQYRQDVRQNLRKAGYSDEWIDAYFANEAEGTKKVLNRDSLMEVGGNIYDPVSREMVYREPQTLAEGMMYDDDGNIVRVPGYWEARKELAQAGGGSGSPSLRNGGVHSQQKLGDGRILTTFRDGTEELAMDPTTGNPAIAADSYFSFDAGGVPIITSRRDGIGTPYATPEEVGTNRGIIEGFKVLGTKQADAIAVLPEAVSTSNRVIASIDELINAPGFAGAYGANRYLPQNMVPGSDAENAAAIRNKLDGQFFVQAVTAMQVSLAPVSDADALRLVASITQLTNPNISHTEALRVANDLKKYFRDAQAKAVANAQRGPMKTDLANAPVTPAKPNMARRLAQKIDSLVPSKLTPEEQAELDALMAEFPE
jgi:hypothetical protein